jgi:hypothetical protein
MIAPSQVLKSKNSSIGSPKPSLPGSTWRLATLVRSARDLLAPHAPLLPLLSVPFLIATLVSALLVPLVVVAALVVLVAAAAA